MKIKAELEGQDHELIIRREGEMVFAQIDGRDYELEVHNASQGEYLLLAGTHVHNCRVENRLQQPNQLVVHVGTHRFQINVHDPRRLSRSHGSGVHHHGSAEIIASMPGKVVRLMVAVGAQVEAGAGIVVVEAMKMQNEMKAPKAGIVVSLNMKEGATVNAGDVLAVIE
ncbi:MAG: biotin/lipoyl attachment protein [Acidobacteria bacterium]|nr:biotin/lipoyl attachment protein [Acidobacteriota bacterium]